MKSLCFPRFSGALRTGASLGEPAPRSAPQTFLVLALKVPHPWKPLCPRQTGTASSTSGHEPVQVKESNLFEKT